MSDKQYFYVIEMGDGKYLAANYDDKYESLCVISEDSISGSSIFNDYDDAVDSLIYFQKLYDNPKGQNEYLDVFISEKPQKIVKFEYKEVF